MSDRATKGGGTAMPIEPGLISRVVRGVETRVRGAVDAWFGPLQPIAPVAPPETAGRQFDYMVGFNVGTAPRQGEAVSFAQMRALADSCDVLRLVIETRKDQLAKLKWTIRPIEDSKEGDDPRIREVKDFFKFPDKEHTFTQWLRMLVEDLLVIDASVIYPRRTLGGKLYALEPIDGATIKRMLGADGRTPKHPDTAYQQVLKGLPATDYTVDELLYFPRNIRTHKVYGYSPVEQVLITVNIALRRQINQLQYYTEGNVPNLLFRVPEAWNPDQIRQFQEMWDALTQGQTKHRGLFIPHGVDPIDTKAQALKDEFDEWLARVICFCFSISPQAFVKEMNRATSETAMEMALEEGLAPLMLWVKESIDHIIWRYFGYADLEFEWADEKDLDQLKNAQVNDLYIRNGVKSVDEVRAELGMDAIGMTNAVYAATGPALIEDILNPPDYMITPDNVQAAPPPEGQTPPEPQKMAKSARRKKKALKPINRNRRAVARARQELRNTIKVFFENAATDMAGQVKTAFEKLNRVDEDEVRRILEELDFKGWSAVVSPTEELLARIYQDGGAAAALQIGVEDTTGLTELLNEKALTYARDRAAEMVGMRRVEGELVPSHNPEWAITDGTREMLRSMISDAIEEGWSPRKLADAIEGHTAFGEARADMIARTEIANADVQGNMAAYRESGVEKKEWILGSEHDDEDECDENALAGPIPMDESFPSGDDAPPAHPRCTCDVLPVLEEEKGEE